MHYEIERKFLVLNDDYKRMATSKADIRQGYIAATAGRTVRIRLRCDTPLTPVHGEPAEPLPSPLPNRGGAGGGAAFLTIKGPTLPSLTGEGSGVGPGLARYEFETEVPLDDARQLLHLCPTPFIDKTRWLVPMDDGHIFEVDEFHGLNDGLVIAEVELQAEDEPFTRPPFLGQEVTGDRRYYNSHLTMNPYQKWGG